MDKKCSVCNQSFEPETGFYYGAMYVSYGINVLIFLAFWIISSYVLPKDAATWKSFVLIITPSLLLVPVTYRLARLVWINMFVSKKTTD
ncbi:MAG: DUF983 domain-containing protein [Bacteroidetes bacterium]|nr:DUF983 domain-containing protein [Bacteroidota bacterium]